MTDIDSELYGDLYGDNDNFGTEEETRIEETEESPSGTATTSTAPVSSTSDPRRSLSSLATTATTSSSTAPALTAKIDSPVSTTTPVTTTPAPLNQPTTSPIATYTTQSIPTYEEPSSAYDNQQPMGGPGGTYLPPERAVRPSEMKDEGKMFIGGLNWDTTDEGLRKYFEQFGKVDACTIMRDAAGRSRCFAFLTFEDPASVNAVMVREHVLDGKIIDPKRAIPRMEHQRATKLFIGGLPGSVTSESMRDYFSQFGKVVDSTVMLDRETGRSKGFGFISFEDTDVRPFLGFGNLEIDGKLIDVKLAQPRHQRENFAEDGSGGNPVATTAAAGGGGRFNNPNPNNPAAAVAAVGGPGAGMPTGQAGNTPFDPQALAQLYTRMFQMAGGALNPAMMGMMGGMGRGMGGMGMGAGNMGMGGANMGMGGAGAGPGGMGGMGANMGRGGGPVGAGMGNIPRGPRGTPPTGPASMTGGVGPQRSGHRGQHYHPYSR